jgi:ZIP family zinc transporter
MTLIPQVLLYTLLPAVATIVGGAIAAVRPPGGRTRSYIQHFAAGVVFSVVAAELLPDVMRRHEPLEIILGFAAGVVTMLGIRRLTESLEKSRSGDQTFPVGLVVAVAVDLVIDGALIGMGFAVGSEEGVLLTLAIAVELLSLGLAVSASLGAASIPKGRAVITTALLALAVPASAAAGATVLAGLSERLLETVLSFGLAALLYLATEELLVEAHEEPETPLATASFFVGFLLFLVLAQMQGT